MIFHRNYLELTEQEQKLWKKARTYYETNYLRGNNSLTAKQLMRYFDLMPRAAWHMRSLFPNNYVLSFVNLQNLENCGKQLIAFEALLNAKANELELLRFINTNEAFHLLTSLFGHPFPFGHHDAYLFKEFPLPPLFVADYLLIGKNSEGYQFIFIELESPEGSVTLASGDLGEVCRKGLNQIHDWAIYLEANFSHLNTVFKKYLAPGAQLPGEFYSFDKTRIHYVVIAGRRPAFKEKTYRLRRNLKRDNIHLLHYDNLLDATHFLLSKYG
jgi:hypothetical protein